MPRISRLDKSQVDEQTGAIFDTYLKERGNVPNMFRTVAHRPEIVTPSNFSSWGWYTVSVPCSISIARGQPREGCAASGCGGCCCAGCGDCAAAPLARAARARSARVLMVFLCRRRPPPR